MSRNDHWTRREVLNSGLAALLAVPSALPAAAEETVALGFTLRETAGLRRFGYPIHALLPDSTPVRNARLLREGRVVPAQFRPVAGPDGRPGLALDFVSSIGPLESERYVVEIGEKVEPGPEPKRGIRVAQEEATFRVASGGSLTFTIGDRLPGLLAGVENARREFLVPKSGGFFVRHRGDAADRGRECVWGRGPGGRPISAAITRQGPFTAALHYEGTADPADAQPLATRLDLTFPSSKSWVEMTWRVEDPKGIVSELRFETRLKLEGEPTLVDLGASSTVYGVLRGREWMGLIAGSAPGLAELGRPWTVRKGTPEAPSMFAEAPKSGSTPAEGWAHIMDATRCTALAVAAFGRASRDRIEIDADGRVRIAREFAGDGSPPVPGRKSLTFWFHFVTMPVQVGAATSPQAMLAPLEISWGDPRP